MLAKVICHIILHLICLSVFGQINTPRIKYFSLENGMSQVSANDMLMDDSGFIWIATADGLNRFDGTVFKHYKNVQKDHTTISGNFITKMAKSKNGNIWIGTNGNGLNCYNPLKDKFSKIKLAGKLNNEIVTDVINNDNDIWVTTLNYGLFHIHVDYEGSTKQYFKNSRLTAIYIDNKGLTWIGTLDGNVKCFKGSPENMISEFEIDGNIRTFSEKGDHLLIGSYEGFYIYNLKTKTLINHELEKSGNFKTMHVVDFLYENDDSVWIASGRGLYLFNLIDLKILQKIEYSETKNTGLSNNTVQSLLKISDNLLLVGTANGLNLLDFNPPCFNNISKNKQGKHVLNDNVIFSIYKDKYLWIGTTDGGLNLITEHKIYYFIDNQNDSKTIAGSVVRAIVHDKNNNRLWMGTTRGLSMIDLKTFNPEKPLFKKFYHNSNNQNSINSDFIMDLELDKHNNLWGATFEQGIFKLEYHSDDTYKIKRYFNDSKNTNSLVNNATQTIAVDLNNNIWIGTQGGLSKIEFQNNSYNKPIFTNFKRDANLANSLSHNSINDILIDTKQVIWLGTRNGLSKLNKDGSFTTWFAQHQFPNALVYSLQDDLEGNLWMGTNDGIVKFDVNLQRFSNYGITDNIQGEEFDVHARFRDDKGTIFLGGIDGLTYFNPKDLESIDKSQELYFSQLRVKDNIIKPTDISQNYLKNTIEKTSQISFDYNQFPFYLTYASLDFRLDKNVQYAYKLLPLDKEWNFLKDTEIQFLNLPSGEYNLQVNGFSRGKEWISKPLEIELHINPPWWFTKVAFIGYLLLLVLITYWVYKFVVSRKLAVAESERLREIDQLKNSLYTNITHEFRTPLTVILGMVDDLKVKAKKITFNESQKRLEMIKRNSENLLKLVNEMLDLTRLENAEIKLHLEQLDIISYAKYIFESFESLANDKDINYTFYSEADVLIMDVDKDKFRAIMTNLLMNAIKFTPQKGKIIVHLNTLNHANEKHLKIKIVDTGIGLSEDDIPNIFGKFYQVDASSSRNHEGTGIGLALTKQLIVLMHGSIKVKSKLNLGSEFIVWLPVTNNSKISTSKKAENKPTLNFNKPKEELITSQNLSFEDTNQSIALIIEDNPDVAYFVKTCIEGKYEVIHAKNGVIGIEMALKYVPDIIICDVMMPEKDGFEVCSILKSEVITDHIPIIILTAKSSDKDRIEGLSRGADAYLIKPFNKTELLIRLDQLVALRNKMITKFSKEDFKEFINRKDKNPEALFIKKVIEFVTESLDDSEFGATQLANKMHLSESQIYRKIKAITNRSTSIFIRSIRLNKAKLILQTTDKTISQVAYEVGFNDPSWFSRAFKEEFGKTPSEIQGKDLD